MFNFARCMNIIFNSLLAQLVKYDVYTTRKIKSIQYTRYFYHILLLYCNSAHFIFITRFLLLLHLAVAPRMILKTITMFIIGNTNLGLFFVS